MGRGFINLSEKIVVLDSLGVAATDERGGVETLEDGEREKSLLGILNVGLLVPERLGLTRDTGETIFGSSNGKSGHAALETGFAIFLDGSVLSEKGRAHEGLTLEGANVGIAGEEVVLGEDSTKTVGS